MRFTKIALTFLFLFIFTSTAYALTPTPSQLVSPTTTETPTPTMEVTISPTPSITTLPTPAPIVINFSSDDNLRPAVVKKIGPDFPVCNSGEELARFGTFTLAVNQEDDDEDPSKIKIELITPDTFIEKKAILKVLQGEGHNWDQGFAPVNGPRSLLSSLPNRAKEFQPEEIVTFAFGQTDDLTTVGTFVDHSPKSGAVATDRDNVTTEYSFYLGDFKSGKNILMIKHPKGKSDRTNSVHVKGVICAVDQTPTLFPSATPTATEAPIPTNTLKPTITNSPTPTNTPSPTVTPSPTPIACKEGPGWASEVIYAAQGLQKDGMNLPLSRMTPQFATGVTDGKFFSLGGKGKIVLKFYRKVKNIPGVDFTVYETTQGRLTYPNETAKVEVSDNGAFWYQLPGNASSKFNALGTSNFDFGTTILNTIQFVRITDTTNFLDFAVDPIADGFDVDAVQGIVLSCEQ